MGKQPESEGRKSYKVYHEFDILLKSIIYLR